MLGSGEKIQTSRDYKTISKSTVTTNLSPFISRVEITLMAEVIVNNDIGREDVQKGE